MPFSTRFIGVTDYFMTAPPLQCPVSESDIACDSAACVQAPRLNALVE